MPNNHRKNIKYEATPDPKWPDGENIGCLMLLGCGS